MVSLVLGAAIVVAVASPHVVAQDASLLTVEQEHWLDERDRTVTLGTDSTYRPYVYFDDGGQLTGLTADYVALLEERLDITIEPRELSGFSEVLAAAEAREIDIVPNVVFSEDRPFLVFTESFITVVDRIFVRNDDEADYSLAGLGGRRLASVEGYAVTDFIDNDFTEIDVVRVETEVEGIFSLSTGEVDVLVADIGIVSYLVQQESITNLRVAGTVDSVSEQRFGVRSDQPILRDILDIGLATIGASEREAITNRWVQLGATEESSNALSWAVGIVALVAALAAMVVLVWNRTLRRSVQRNTEKLRHELERHERTELERSRLELAISQAAELVVVVDADWSVRFLNPTYERVSGRSAANRRGQPLDELFTTADDRETLHDARATLAKHGVWKGRLALEGVDSRMVAVDGAIASFTMPSGEPGGFVGTLRDATHEEALQAQLQRSERLKAVGTLAAGIAHDFNNLLTPIIGNAELLATTDDEQLRSEYLQSITDAAQRASDLVQQVRSFSLDQKSEAKLFDLGPVVAEAAELVRQTCPDDVIIECVLPAVALIIDADPSQIHQIAMNLLTNAVQAMEANGGQLRVELAEQSGGGNSTDDPKSAANAVAELLVVDTGTGIDDATRKRLFEPYFSTRIALGGTGLGLFTVVGIVRLLGGDIEVDTELGQGTSVRVLLPITSGRAVPAVQPVHKLRAKDEPGRILVVDDEAAVLDVVEATLRVLGHEVTACASGSVALDCLDRGDPFDLLLTDLGMPGLRGDELARRAQVCRPGLPVLILTGYDDTETGTLDPDWVVLAKPVGMAALDEAVRRALATRELENPE